MSHTTFKMSKVFAGSYEFTDSLGQTWRARTYAQATWQDGDGWVLSCDEDFDGDYYGVHKTKSQVVKLIESYVNNKVKV